jgi:hypothetical protein
MLAALKLAIGAGGGSSFTMVKMAVLGIPIKALPVGLPKVKLTVSSGSGEVSLPITKVTVLAAESPSAKLTTMGVSS